KGVTQKDLSAVKKTSPLPPPVSSTNTSSTSPTPSSLKKSTKKTKKSFFGKKEKKPIRFKNDELPPEYSKAIEQIDQQVRQQSGRGLTQKEKQQVLTMLPPLPARPHKKQETPTIPVNNNNNIVTTNNNFNN